MKILLYIFCAVTTLGIILTSCQRSYMDEPEDVETSTIYFRGITSSCDSACLYDTIVLSADAVGENLKYEWQRAKGSLAGVKGDPSKVYFWGCYTCVGRLTISCTVSNEYGSYTKNVDVFVWPWTKEKGRWEGWEKYIDLMGQW